MRTIFAAVAALCTILSLPAAAQQVAGEGDKSPGKLETPPLGVPTPVERGLYADLQVGTFFTLNGNGAAPAVSNAEPFLGLAVGYDVSDNVVAGLAFAYGASSGTCYGSNYVAGEANPCLDGANSFSVLMVNAYGGYLYPVSRLWYLGAKVSAGLALMTPRPVLLEGQEGPAMGFNAGLLATTEFHTNLDHFVVGLDVGGQYLSAGSGVAFPGIAIYPHLKYVF